LNRQKAKEAKTIQNDVVTIMTKPKALLGWRTKFEMVILVRFGKTIFKTSDKNNPYNCKVNNTLQVLPPSIYL